jgi:hypothetical protein
MFASIARPASRHLRRSFSVTPFARPSVSDDVGIVAISHYIPKRFVSQADLEVFDKVSKGKYEIGLGQKEMSFCGDNEDINSIALTAVSRLLYTTKIFFKLIIIVQKKKVQKILSSISIHFHFIISLKKKKKKNFVAPNTISILDRLVGLRWGRRPSSTSPRP